MFDVYSYEGDIYDLFEYVYKNDITISKLHKKNIYFFNSSYKYRNLLKLNSNVSYLYSIGFIGMIFRFNLEKIIAFIFSSILLFGLSNTIFDVEVVGESINHKEMIDDKLSDFKVPFFYFNENQMMKRLKELNEHLNWYEINRKGSTLKISYLPRKKEMISDSNSFDLIAEKEGVIASFDVIRGNKVVSVNQKVNKGDLLVSHITLDSQSIEKTSDVIGKVYAYTFVRVDVEIENRYPVGIGYYICLLKSRNELVLEEDERIVREISLQFYEDFDTIRMSNFYVLYEMISIVGE